MNLKLLSSTSAVGVILMDKAVGPLIRGVQQFGLPSEKCNSHRSILPEEASEKVECVNQAD